MVGLGTGAHDAGHRRDHPQAAEGLVQLRVGCPEIGDSPGIKPWRAVPDQGREVFAHRVDPDVAGNGDDTPTDDDGRHIDLVALQPFGTAHVVRLAPGARDVVAALVPGQWPSDLNFLAELVEHQRAGEGLIERQSGQHVRLVPLGRAAGVETQQR